MKYTTRILAAFAIFFILTGFNPKKASAISGSWIGEYTSIDRSVPFRVHFWNDEDGLKGTIDFVDESSKELNLSWVMVESTSVHFELVRTSGTLVFDGQLKDGKISGDLLYSNLRGKFQLTPENVVSL